jgi:putative salt-induced outer membrane protein
MKILPLLALAMASASAFADDRIDDTWHTSAELGAITTSGNTAGTSVSGKIDARQELDDWSNQYIVSGHFKEDEVNNSDGERSSKRSAERYLLSAKAAYKLMKDDEKLFVLAAHAGDKFGAYTSYTTMAIGHSTRLYKSPAASVEVEIGPGYFNGERATGEPESGFTVRGAAAMRWQVSQSAHFSQQVSVERGTSNVHSSAEAALSTKINGTMQMKAAFIARNDTNVPADKKNTDTQTSLTLVYSF